MPPQTRSGEAGPSLRSRNTTSSKVKPPPPQHLEIPPTKAIHQSSPSSALKLGDTIGRLPDEVYDRALPPWRARWRRRLVRRLESESEAMGRWQRRVRNEGRDAYFYWTALFGTHEFFLTFLPMFFFFGFHLKGRGMINVTGLGIYTSSVFKDLVCCPRPFSPPVIRLSMSTHANEYGFLSSHSTNSVSMALFAAQWLWEERAWLGDLTVGVGFTVLMVYAASVVGGRLYTGMHSIADVVAGSLLGVACWVWWIVIEKPAEAWLHSGSWTFPGVLFPLTLFIIHYHPEPVEDCPCFEDSIAMLSVMLGVFVGHWWAFKQGYLYEGIVTRSIFDQPFWVAVLIVVYRMVFGIGTLVVWRLIVKTTLLKVLPPTFRATSQMFSVDLPTRKHYTAATDYAGSPSIEVHAIPSFVDLQRADLTTLSGDSSPVPSPITRSASTSSTDSALSTGHLAGRPRKVTPLSTHVNDTAAVNAPAKPKARSNRSRAQRQAERLRYDAEVLTKFGVYSGIGYIASTVVEVWFNWIEVNVLGLVR